MVFFLNTCENRGIFILERTNSLVPLFLLLNLFRGKVFFCAVNLARFTDTTGLQLRAKRYNGKYKNISKENPKQGKRGTNRYKGRKSHKIFRTSNLRRKLLPIVTASLLILYSVNTFYITDFTY